MSLPPRRASARGPRRGSIQTGTGTRRPLRGHIVGPAKVGPKRGNSKAKRAEARAVPRNRGGLSYRALPPSHRGAIPPDAKPLGIRRLEGAAPSAPRRTQRSALQRAGRGPAGPEQPCAPTRRWILEQPWAEARAASFSGRRGRWGRERRGRPSRPGPACPRLRRGTPLAPVRGACTADPRTALG